MRKPPVLSRVTSGNKLLPTVDGRTLWAKLTRECLTALIAHCGGEGHVSETRRIAARRVATIETELIFLEDKFARARDEGHEPAAEALDLYGRLADRQRRLSDALGWTPAQRDVTPDLQAYLKTRAKEVSGGDAEE